MEDAAPIPVRNHLERPDPLRPDHTVFLFVKLSVPPDVLSHLRSKVC